MAHRAKRARQANESSTLTKSEEKETARILYTVQQAFQFASNVNLEYLGLFTVPEQPQSSIRSSGSSSSVTSHFGFKYTDAQDQELKEGSLPLCTIFEKFPEWNTTFLVVQDSGFPVSCFRGHFLANETDLNKRVNAVLNFASHLPETGKPRSVNNFYFSRLLPTRPPTLN